MKRSAPFPAVSLEEHSRQWEAEGIPILRAQAFLPHLSSPLRHCRSIQRFNRFYYEYLRAFWRFCAKDILPRAKEDFGAAAAQSRPLPLTKATLRSVVAYEKNGLVSLYTDLTVTAPQSRFHTRSADTWDLGSGYPVALSDLYPTGYPIKKELVRFARQMAAERIKAGEVFCENYRRALRRHFSSRRFYLTPQGLVFFYPRGLVAPAEQGTVTFLVPYGENGPVLPA